MLMVDKKTYLQHYTKRIDVYRAMVDPDSTDIQHYGVKGMKWGRTKPENRSEHGGGGFSKKKPNTKGLEKETSKYLDALHQPNTMSVDGGGGGGVSQDEDVNEFNNLLAGLHQPNTMPNPLLKDKVDSKVSDSSKATKETKKKGESFVSKVLNGLKKLNSATTNYNKHELGEDKFSSWLPKKKKAG